MKKCLHCDAMLEDDAILCPVCAGFQTESFFPEMVGDGNESGQGPLRPTPTPPKPGEEELRQKYPGYDAAPWAPPELNQPGPNAPDGQAPFPHRPPRAAVNCLLWSFGLLLFCYVFALPSLVVSAMACNTADPEEAARKTKLARALCIVETVFLVLSVIVAAVIITLNPGLLNLS